MDRPACGAVVPAALRARESEEEPLALLPRESGTLSLPPELPSVGVECPVALELLVPSFVPGSEVAADDVAVRRMYDEEEEAEREEPPEFGGRLLLLRARMFSPWCEDVAALAPSGSCSSCAPSPILLERAEGAAKSDAAAVVLVRE